MKFVVIYMFSDKQKFRNHTHVKYVKNCMSALEMTRTAKGSEVTVLLKAQSLNGKKTYKSASNGCVIFLLEVHPVKPDLGLKSNPV